MKDHAVIIVHVPERPGTEDLEVPLFITANELILALSEIYEIPAGRDRLFSYYLKSEYPTSLLRGNRTLGEYGIRDGSEIWFWEQRLTEYYAEGEYASEV